MIRSLSGLLFVALFPILLITSTLRYAINEPRLYLYGFDKYQVAAATGIARNDLKEVAAELIAYLNSGPEPLRMRTVVAGEERQLFNEREVVHLGDVKGLIQLMYRLQEVSALYIVGYVLVALFWVRGRVWSLLAGRLVGGSLATLLLLTIVGLGALLWFDQLFIWFHRLSFSNLFWMLDPRTDYLIRLFPQGFFLDATLMVAGAAAAEAVLLGGLGAIYLVLAHR